LPPELRAVQLPAPPVRVATVMNRPFHGQNFHLLETRAFVAH
jgi:hypothetical protein